MILISTSILSADFSCLKEEVINITKANTDMIHIDVMDGNFVPNITIGMDVIKSIKPYSDKIFDVHLMINNPELLYQDFIKAGADIITFHPEATMHPHSLIQKIKQHNCKVGIALLPTTNINILDYLLYDIDLILIMSVNPGFGGQKFITSQLEKITAIKNKLIENNLYDKIILSVDGGINDKTYQKTIQAGANCLVSGSYIFNHNDSNHNPNKKYKIYQRNINLLKGDI